MENNFDSYLEAFIKTKESGQDMCLVSLVDAKGSIPQNIGAKMIVTQKGISFGTVGGGKIEAKVLNVALEMLSTNTQRTSLYKWNLQKDIGMTCGGEVSLYFETYISNSFWNIVIFGAGHVSQELTRILARLNCKVTVIDHRTEWLEKLPDNIIKINSDSPKDLIGIIPSNSFVILMTMGHSTDLPILAEILNQNIIFPYVGVIGSVSKRNALLNGLDEYNVTQSKREQFICPIGEPIGSNSPCEIAISISAQLLKFRDNL